MAWDSLLKRTETATTPKIHGWNLRIRPWKKEKKTSSKPNHHFQKIIVNLQGCTMDTCVTYLSHLITIVVSHLLVDLHSTWQLLLFRRSGNMMCSDCFIWWSMVVKSRNLNTPISLAQIFLAELEWTHYSFNQFSELKDIWWPGYRCVSSLFYL